MIPSFELQRAPAWFATVADLGHPPAPDDVSWPATLAAAEAVTDA